MLEEALELGMLAGEAGPFSPPDAREVLHRPDGRRDAGRDKGADGGIPESAGVRLVQRRLLEATANILFTVPPKHKEFR